MSSTIILSGALSLLACYAIYFGWAAQKRLWAYVGWAGLVLSVVAWSSALGVEYGIAVGLFVPAIGVWAGIAQHASVEPVKPLIHKPAHQWRWRGKSIAINAWHIAYVLLIQLFAFCLIVAALINQLPMSESKQMATGAIVLPLLWGVFAYGYVMSDRKWRHVVGLFLLAVVAALYLFGVTHG